jgi:hypothetical protein
MRAGGGEKRMWGSGEIKAGSPAKRGVRTL